MKKVLLALAAFFALNTPAFSQTPQQKQKDNVFNKPVVCYPTPDLLTVMQEKFKEELAFIVAHEYNEETLIAMFVNTEKTTYTIIEFNHETACILATGAGFKLLPLKPPGIPI